MRSGGSLFSPETMTGGSAMCQLQLGSDKSTQARRTVHQYIFAVEDFVDIAYRLFDLWIAPKPLQHAPIQEREASDSHRVVFLIKAVRQAPFYIPAVASSDHPANLMLRSTVLLPGAPCKFES